MARKNTKQQQQANKSDRPFVILHDEKNSRDVVVSSEKLINCKTDKLKIGGSATFNGDGDRSSRFQGTVIAIGTKEQCEASRSLIEKSNKNIKPGEYQMASNEKSNKNNKKTGEIHMSSNEKSNKNNKKFGENQMPPNEKSNKNNKKSGENNIRSSENSNDNNKELGELESDSSNHLFIDEQTEESEESEGDDNNEEQSDKEGGMLIEMPVSRQADDTTVKKKNSTMSSITITANSQSSSTLPPTTTSCVNKVLDKNNNIIVDNQKRKERSEELVSNTKKTKCSNKITRSMFEQLQRDNKMLRREIKMYRTNWMYKPTGAAANYFIEIGNILSGSILDYDDDGDVVDRGTKLEEIILELGMNEQQLKFCEHKTDIKKTCRKIIKYKYRDPKERAEMLVSSMDAGVLKAVQTYARLAHPAQLKVANSILNNAIGNVFATEKRKQEREEEIEQYMLNQPNDDDDEEDDNTEE